jgi:hypothetical protein
MRGDSYAYETNSVEDVIGEDNENWRAITRLELIASQKGDFDFKLNFSKKGVTVEIVGDDRDAVFLLCSDLREYIRNEVLAGHLLSRNTALTMGLFFVLSLLMAFFYNLSLSTQPAPDLVAKALAADNLAEKLNFLIEERIQKNFSWRHLARFPLFFWCRSLALV